ncbi:hypothetical protein VPHK299_0056 [Vibrio phage K299]
MCSCLVLPAARHFCVWRALFPFGAFVIRLRADVILLHVAVILLHAAVCADYVTELTFYVIRYCAASPDLI